MRVAYHCFAVLLFCVATARPSHADGYAVTINAYWQLGTLEGNPTPPPSPNPELDQFSASFDVYADGSLVPGTMNLSFWSADSDVIGTLSFGPPPVCPPALCFQFTYPHQALPG
jgi:hypothetical protein